MSRVEKKQKNKEVLINHNKKMHINKCACCTVIIKQ